MIGEALAFVCSNLDNYLKIQFELDESVVVLNNLVQQDGSVAEQNQNKVIISMINLDVETSKQFYGGKKNTKSNVLRINPAIRFNLSTLFASNFDDYRESLKFLNATIRFFQANNTLDSHNFPNIPSGIEKLQFEVENIDSFQTHNLWSSMGAKYIPSVLYRIRHISIQADEIDTTVEKIVRTSSKVNP